MGCRIHRKQQWTTRMLLELQTHEEACFLTMTYETDGSLNVTDWQAFADRTRKRLGAFRYYQCGEYGDATKRRHHHAILFGLDLSDRNDLATELWRHGHCDVGEANSSSIGYVAGYVTKKLTGPMAKAYEHVDESTGEVVKRKPPFATMSLKPGIGEPFYRRWKDQIYPRDEVIIDGRKIRPPEYFDTLYEREHPTEFAKIKAAREESAEEFYSEDNAQRRSAADEIAKARDGLRTGALHHKGA